MWNTAAELFPQAGRTIDRFHAKGHLGKLGMIPLGDSPEAPQWLQSRHDELDEDRLQCLMHALHLPVDKHEQARECLHSVWNTRRRMHYAKFRRQSLGTSTCVAEAGQRL